MILLRPLGDEGQGALPLGLPVASVSTGHSCWSAPVRSVGLPTTVSDSGGTT